MVANVCDFRASGDFCVSFLRLAADGGDGSGPRIPRMGTEEECFFVRGPSEVAGPCSFARSGGY